MSASARCLAPRPTPVKKTRRRRRAQRWEQRDRILRERVAYMLWVMANVVD
jgi:hypothetical protein